MNSSSPRRAGSLSRRLLQASLSIALLGISQYNSQAGLVKRVVEGPQNAYFVYPHSNGFLPDGRTYVAARPERDGLTFLAFDPATGTQKELGWFPHVDLYYSLSEDWKRMAFTADNTLYLWEIESGQPPKVVYQDTPEEAGKWWHTVSDISPKGDAIVSMRKRRKGADPGDDSIKCQMLRHDLTSGKTEVLMETDWWLNHVHFSPYDPSWICFSHEGDADKVADRIWAWNAQDAPKGKVLFTQTGQDGKPLQVGHERAAFHSPSMVFIAYGTSEGSPRGLYEVGFDGKSRLVSQGDRDMHCNISRDGRWAVVDTSGPHDAPGKGWENSNSVSDVMAVNMQTGKREMLYRTSILKHPWHPHPNISPDGRWIVLNDAKTHRTVALEIDPEALGEFLKH
ncbi:oligogalacturonate lyase [Terrimicrobium sacchariphilum]|uniref:Oligogalacturonate lyase n=1 Tax=Terrimicrobium sacchariphilum TaxID=690879 RepID=A0A146GCH7_TERSA|nr:oligogalacturonate lyase family protein [Terrimicrobium sacchariphilum]GAT34397.1 oligogalacturonate lyase [Terrimicrobium sacchariphilum]